MSKGKLRLRGNKSLTGASRKNYKKRASRDKDHMEKSKTKKELIDEKDKGGIIKSLEGANGKKERKLKKE